MRWFTYQLPPMDLGWMALHPIEYVRSELLDAHFAQGDPEDLDHRLAEFEAGFEAAQACARKMGWKGDFAEGPTVFWLPSDCEPLYGFIWKSDDNGTTYAAAPVRLPYLNSTAFAQTS